MATVTLINPASAGATIQGRNGVNYTADQNGVVVVNVNDVGQFISSAGFRFYRTSVGKVSINSAVPADLITIKAAATPANGAITIAAQPPHARKLQVRIVIGTTTTTAITAGTLTLVGVDQDGNAINEVISLIENASATIVTAHAYASLTSGTVAGYTASGSGTGNTLGLGPSNDFGMPGAPAGSIGLACLKATKITKVLGTSNIAADDVASTTTVDTTARTIAPTTAPAASGLVDFEFTYSFGLAD